MFAKPVEVEWFIVNQELCLFHIHCAQAHRQSILIFRFTSS